MNILNSSSSNINIPKDVLVIKKFLENLGIEEYEKSTLTFMSEFLNTYITDILKEAKFNMLYSNRNQITIDDVKFAVQNKQIKDLRSKPNINLLKEIAKKINSKVLPNIPETPYVILPPQENNLLKNNFQVYSKDLEDFYTKKEQIKNNNETSSFLCFDTKNYLGNKRKEINADSENKANKKRIKLLNEFNNKQHKHRKLSLSQAFKNSKNDAEKKKNKIVENENSDDNKEDEKVINNNFDYDDEDVFAQDNEEENEPKKKNKFENDSINNNRDIDIDPFDSINKDNKNEDDFNDIDF